MYLSPRASITTTCNILNTTAVLFSDPLLQTCIQPTSLSRLWTVQNVSAKTVYGLLNGYLNDVCAAPICNNQTIQSAFDTAFNGCEEVIGNALNGTGIDIEQLSDYIPLLPTIKDAACLVSTENASSANDYFDTKYCSILTVQAYEQAIDRQLNWDFFLGLNSGLISYSALVPNKTSKSTELLCTDCTKSLYNHLRPIGNDTASIEANVTSSLTTANVLTTLGKALGDLCGPDFLDGVEPTTVVNGTDTRLLPEMNLATSGAFAVLPSFNRPAAFLATAMLLAISTM